MGVLDGKVAIVTGAGRRRGIGRATAVALAVQGADVVVTSTGRDPATFPADEKAANWNDIYSTVEQIEAQGRCGLALIGDISQQADVARMVQQTLATFGRIDIEESRNGCHPVWTDWHGQARHALCPASHA